ncbi:aminoacyl-tRNA hydrolase [Crocosphaera sp. UHCC 0190]|uniref:aminoacyl-tRNA hydrolase n=1 Tax=Crocosphaera sp. UHCC 0190 TaxID=3110246 RepID=UPI002B211161|nr:aminoacyl-tRNA hydrolase [Crocosphaera sp. UHCC 0190]MEA5509770.1 aminoacyl-tRNA hydrolase [Crocosphaera sp. UHCC 0190]
MSQENSPSLMIPQLIVGLGNPEAKYDKTRHNIGFEVVDKLADAWQLSWKENRRFQGMIAEGNSRNNQKVYLLKPLTYMNRSGQSVRAVTDWYKLNSADVLTIYDDMDLPIGRMRMRLSGSAGGHNGMKSIIAHLGNQNFPRLRIGIGKSNHTDETISHVLGRFSPDEKVIIDKIFPLVVDAVEMSLKQGIEKAMSLFNSQTVTK